MMRGYWRNPAATAATITSDGWLRTGDLGYIGHDKLVYIVDRSKELIKVKGNQVAPAELEAVRFGLSGVADCGIVGVSDEETGSEKVKAYVVRSPSRLGASLTADIIIKWMQERTARYKWLAGGVRDSSRAFPETLQERYSERSFGRWSAKIRGFASEQNCSCLDM